MKIKLNFLAGKKTHIVAAVLVLSGVADALGADGTVDLPTLLDGLYAHKREILEGLGLSAMRAGIDKVFKIVRMLMELQRSSNA